jgi:hypothetical protein
VSNPGQQDADGDGYGNLCDSYGDVDHDGDVDLNDFSAFALCYSGSGVTIAPAGCNTQTFADLDFNNDGDVDLADFNFFALLFTG